MADRLTPEQRRLNMSRVRSRDTKAELSVRRALHACGFRFRLHRTDMPGKPDVVLPKHRAVILVHGCFWHGHDCQLFRLPSTRTEFWAAKILINRRRDRTVLDRLADLDWRVAVVWECAVRGNGRLEDVLLKERLTDFVSGVAKQADIAGAYARDGMPVMLAAAEGVNPSK